jgi:hypothetical protein
MSERIRTLITSVIGVALLGVSASRAHATAPLNQCNSSGECRARLASVYTQGQYAYVVLQGHLLPSVCTNAQWGYYWVLPLATDADRARYAMMLSAYLAQEVVEIRALDAACTVMASNIGE